AVDGDGERAGRGQHRRVVADQLVIEAAPQPAQQAVLPRERAGRARHGDQGSVAPACAGRRSRRGPACAGGRWGAPACAGALTAGRRAAAGGRAGRAAGGGGAAAPGLSSASSSTSSMCSTKWKARPFLMVSGTSARSRWLSLGMITV